MKEEHFLLVSLDKCANFVDAVVAVAVLQRGSFGENKNNIFHIFHMCGRSQR
jgi:hypothetical protein